MKVLPALFLLSITLFFASFNQIAFAQIQKGQDIDGKAAGDLFGGSVSMPDANTVGIRAIRGIGIDTITIYTQIFRWNDTNWIQKGLDIEYSYGHVAGSFTSFGSSVCMPDANSIVIGYPRLGGYDNGFYRVYYWNGVRWRQKGLDISSEFSSGYSTSMPDANTIAFSGSNSIIGSNHYGYVKVYNWNGIAWIQKGSNIDEYCNSKGEVSMPDANTVAMRMGWNGRNPASSKCPIEDYVRIYQWNGVAWKEKGGGIKLSNERFTGNRSNSSLSMPDNNTVVVGIQADNIISGNLAGLVRVYRWNGSNWQQKGSDFEGEGPGDRLGFSLSMPDSNTLAIGAPSHFVNGLREGRVQIYKWKDTTWQQEGLNIDGERANDWSGYSISMPDVNTVAIGAPYNNEGGTNSGHVRVYSFCISDSIIATQVACDSYTWVDGITYASSTNNPTITLTNARGCDSVVTLNLTINPSTSSEQVIIACDSYTWIDGLTYTSSTNTPTYVLTNSLGCDSVITLDLTINSNDTSIIKNNNTLIVNQQGAAYQWLDCDNRYSVISGETNREFTPSQIGSYACEITLNSCKDTTACIQVLGTGVETNDLAKWYKIYPNPFANQLIIETTDVQENTFIEFFSINGQIVAEMTMNLGGKTIINTADWAKGMYFIRLTDKEGVRRFKLIRL